MDIFLSLSFATLLAATYFIEPLASLAGALLTACGLMASAGRKGLWMTIPSSLLLVVLSASLMLEGTVCHAFPQADIKAIYGTVIQDSVPGRWERRRVDIGLEECFIKGGASGTARGTVSVTYPGDVRLYRGEQVLFRGSYGEYGFNAVAFELVSRPVGQAHRSSLLARIEEALMAGGGDDDRLSLMLLLGYSDEASFPLTSLARASGTSHVLALSGMHLALFSKLLGLLLTPLLGKRQGRALALCLIAAYVFLTGCKASMVRAFLLSSLFFILPGIRGLHALIGAFIIQAMILPSSLLSLASCYSYLSLAGIMALSKPLMKAIDSIVVLPSFVTGNLAAGTAAVLYTAPLSLAVFSTYQLSGIFTGGLLSFLVQAYMLISMLPFLPPVVKEGCYALIEAVMSLGARFPACHDITGWLVLLASVLLLAALWAILTRRRGGRKDVAT